MSPAFGVNGDEEMTIQRSTEPVPNSIDSIVSTVERLKKSEKASEHIKNAIKSMILNKALSWHPEGL